MSGLFGLPALNTCIECLFVSFFCQIVACVAAITAEIWTRTRTQTRTATSAATFHSVSIFIFYLRLTHLLNTQPLTD